eukprot:c13856_g1_i3.p1 GENE.c13856_g1_i3~~c13856_g1_i3.p1  ORF type:complete len:373 (+),score=130.76 c13856_g1_i3:23-1141(+)
MENNVEKKAINEPLIAIPYENPGLTPGYAVVQVAGNVEQPPQVTCSIVCLVISGLLIFALMSPALVWPNFYTTAMILFAFVFVLALVGACSPLRQSWPFRPITYFSFALIVFILLAMALTFIDYRDKCTNRMDLADRPLRNAFAFDCEFGLLLLAFWVVGIAILVIILVVLAIMSLQLTAAFDGYQMRIAYSNLPKLRIIGNTIAVIVIVIGFIVLMVYSFSGYPTETVPGQCPAGSDFFAKPEYNDLGCCSWTAKSGTCCRQSACQNKASFTTTNSTCSDKLGLLSCSVCHTTSGDYATSIKNITICSSFCDQLYEACAPLYSYSAKEYCTERLSMIVVPDNAGIPCFSAAPSIELSVFAFALLLLFAFSF